MPSSLWNLVGEIAQDLGKKDARGRHSAVIREMVAAAAAKWIYSPYVCRYSQHTIYVTAEGNFFSRQVQSLRLNNPRQKIPCYVEMKPEKRDYYHKNRKHQDPPDEHRWFLDQWLLNYFGVWSGKKDPDDLDAFRNPLSSYTDAFGTTYKSADLPVHLAGGRFLTREIIIGLRDYVQWKEIDTPIFDRADIPIDIPTSELEVCVAVDMDLFSHMEVEDEEISNLALEFRNRESARFEGKDVALYSESYLEEQFGRSPDDDGADEILRRVRRLRQRIYAVLDTTTSDGELVSDHADKNATLSSCELPEKFLFYWLRWPSPHLGIETCVRWEKPVREKELREQGTNNLR